MKKLPMKRPEDLCNGELLPEMRCRIRKDLYIALDAYHLSALSVATLLVYVGFKLFRRFQAPRVLRKHSMDVDDWDASNSVYFISLMCAELVQALGGLLNIQWIIDATVLFQEVTEGPLCKAQGILKQMGDVTVALTQASQVPIMNVPSLAIHTFNVLVMRWRVPPLLSVFIISLIWIFIALNVGLSSATHPGNYYGNTGYWCWIRDEYSVERIALEYLWLWIALAVMVILYGLIALVMRGFIVLDEGIHFMTQRNRRWQDLTAADDEDERQSKAVANLMLFYPAVYAICVFPITIVRWLSFSDGVYVPPGATFFAGILFSSSGLLNSILYTATRPNLVPSSNNTSRNSRSKA
ncbi:uncharacterized protein EV420DRAFT_1750560 [Desarmillaria tabescens]|uniref:Glucose receptor Git3 N-terminal domain-containing protein n=1 Tax=Armillaria tabescens TaxID=1929756 RepID=A0AA39JVN6_ARMTA|nr:uncharacterized protein EV420DRAFT_1750560 [Desarmillaria tabescens]KAK0449785.1 hypothetical protein EV420DRAFT_1750560 [Desarmillaria tabescens]